MKNLSSWGRYPKCDSQVHSPINFSQLANQNQTFVGISRGMGRSYGDSALDDQVIQTRYLDHFIHFDRQTGQLTIAAGVTLADILEVTVRHGWFLPVTPGTKFVSVAGAIASDVHGKNHHIDGSFSDHLISMQMLLADGSQITVSPTEHPDLFQATCGGMGLTGIILSATIQLLAINSSQIEQTTYKADNLAHCYELFEQTQSATYSVAWIDCLASGDKLGRSLLMTGEHSQYGPLNRLDKGKLSIAMDAPSFMLNQYSVQAFNELYYQRIFKSVQKSQIHYEPFFYPLDGIHHWNRLYGKRGFVQYQFVLPQSAGISAMTSILEKISANKRGSFLAVLKLFGEGNNNLLSFPEAGHTLALDFKMEADLLPFLDQLDDMVLAAGGKIYLAKDARMSAQTFQASYPNWQAFEQIREKYQAIGRYQSLQSKRLGLA